MKLLSLYKLTFSRANNCLLLEENNCLNHSLETSLFICELLSFPMITNNAAIRTLRSDNGDGNGNLRSLGRGSLCDVGVPAKI